jgi:hypothetical protein
MDWETVSTRIWLPMDLRATFRPCTSGTPAPSKRAQHPAETRHGELRDQRADQRRAQNQSLPRAPAFFGGKPGAHQKAAPTTPAATSNP